MKFSFLLGFLLFLCISVSAQEQYYYRKGDNILTLSFTGLNERPGVRNRIKLNGVWHFFQQNDSLKIKVPNGQTITIELVNRNGCSNTHYINLTNEESCGLLLNRSVSREP